MKLNGHDELPFYFTTSLSQIMSKSEQLLCEWPTAHFLKLKRPHYLSSIPHKLRQISPVNVSYVKRSKKVTDYIKCCLFNFFTLSVKLHVDMSIPCWLSLIIFIFFEYADRHLTPIWTQTQTPTPGLNVHMMRGSLGNKREACKACLSRPFVYIPAKFRCKDRIFASRKINTPQAVVTDLTGLTRMDSWSWSKAMSSFLKVICFNALKVHVKPHI